MENTWYSVASGLSWKWTLTPRGAIEVTLQTTGRVQVKVRSELEKPRYGAPAPRFTLEEERAARLGYFEQGLPAPHLMPPVERPQRTVTTRAETVRYLIPIPVVDRLRMLPIARMNLDKTRLVVQTLIHGAQFESRYGENVHVAGPMVLYTVMASADFRYDVRPDPTTIRAVLKEYGFTGFSSAEHVRGYYPRNVREIPKPPEYHRF